MAKNDGVLGISVRHGKLAMTVMRGGNVKTTVWEEIPNNIVDDYKILAGNLFAEFLREKMHEHKIRCKKAAYVLADSEIFIRNIRMPDIDDEQLRLNIPFEFRDYIQGTLKDYVFDFVKRDRNDGENAGQIDLLAFAVPFSLMQDLMETMKLAGLKLEKAIPETCVYETLLSEIKDSEESKKERCFMDIGNNHIGMRVFRDGKFKLSHIIDIGEQHIVQAMADDLNVDMHLASTYLRTNYQDCQKTEAAMNAYKDISLEVIKGLNFYDMSDMSSRLKDIVLCGSGAMITPLSDLLKERIDKDVVTMQDFLKDHKDTEDLNITFASLGVLLCDTGGMNNASDIVSVSFNQKRDLKGLLIGTAVIVVAAILVAKFGVLDQFDKLARAQAREQELQARYDADVQFIKTAGELSDEYYHYTWDGMTEEELGRVSRVDVAKLADFIAQQGVSVRTMSLKESVLTVGVTGDTLDTMSKLTASLAEQDVVESCSLASAQKEYVEEEQTFEESAEGTESTEEAVTEETEETEEVEEEETSEDTESQEEETGEEVNNKVSTQYVVNAEIKIYLKALSSASEEVKE